MAQNGQTRFKNLASFAAFNYHFGIFVNQLLTFHEQACVDIKEDSI